MLAFSASQISNLLGGKIIGNEQRTVSNVASLEEAKEGDLCFLCGNKYVPFLPLTQASVVLMSRDIAFEGKTNATLILVENARGAMAQLLQLVAKTINPQRKGIEQPCYISEGVSVPEDAYVGAFAYIGRNVKIGHNVQIYPQTYVGDNVQIGDNTILYPGVKIYYNCSIGKQCILHSGVIIGGDGFGFEPNENRINQKIPQIGRVIIEDDVEIGANTTVDRAMMGETRVGENTKIDNLVQVAHNVKVGQSNFLCAQVGIAGSTQIGNHCILAGQTGVAGHISIPDNCVFGAQTGVAGTIKQPGMYQGSPAIDAATWRRASVVFKNLPEIYRKINQNK